MLNDMHFLKFMPSLSLLMRMRDPIIKEAVAEMKVESQSNNITHT
jgi:hypothetical protein